MSNHTLSNTLGSRLSKHFALGAIAAVAAASSTTATAAIVYSGVVNLNIPSTAAGVYLNVVTGVSGATPASAPGWDINPWSLTTLALFYNAASPSDGSIVNLTGGSSAVLADNLPFGTVINGSFTYGRGTGIETTGATAFLTSSTSNIVGFRFLNEGAATMNFGWARISTSTTLGAQPRFIVEYAYENTGAAILAGDTGAVPEPSALALLGLGSLFALRRRR